MMRWRPARAAAHRLFSAEFARKDGQPRKKISRLGVGQPLHWAQIEPLAQWSRNSLINRYVHDTELSTWHSSLAGLSSMYSIFSSMRIFDPDLLYDYFNRPDVFVLKFIFSLIYESP